MEPVLPDQVDRRLYKIEIKNSKLRFQRATESNFVYTEKEETLTLETFKSVEIRNQFLGLNVAGQWEWRRMITLDGQIM